MCGEQIAPMFAPILANTLIMMRLYQSLTDPDWLSELYINTLNVIHFMHDKYNTKVYRWPSMMRIFYVLRLVV